MPWNKTGTLNLPDQSTFKGSFAEAGSLPAHPGTGPDWVALVGSSLYRNAGSGWSNSGHLLTENATTAPTPDEGLAFYPAMLGKTSEGESIYVTAGGAYEQYFPITSQVQDALDAKAPLEHGHAQGEIAGLSGTLSSLESDVSSALTGLDGKSNLGHTHGILGVTGLDDQLTSLNQVSSEAWLKTYGPTVPLDLRDSPARFIATLGTGPERVMQCPVRETVTGEWFVSQWGTTGSDPEAQTAIIHRLHSSGQATGEVMHCDNGGHGTTIAVERDENGIMWIWMNWKDVGGLKVDPNQYVMTRIRFRDGLITLNSPDVQIYDDFHNNAYTNLALDLPNDWVIIRYGIGQNDYYERRKFSEFKAGIDVVYNVVGPIHKSAKFNGGMGTMQGYASLGDTFYYLVGMGGVHYPEDPNEILVFSWVTGEHLYTIDVEYVGKGGPLNRHYRNRNEPEGISVYYDQQGRATLLMGVTMGISFDRQNEVWGWTQAQGSMEGEAIKNLWEQMPQGGLATFSPSAANEPYSFAVTFNRPFREPPLIMLTNAALADPRMVQLSLTGNSTTGFNIRCVRTNTATTNVYWIAFPRNYF